MGYPNIVTVLFLVQILIYSADAQAPHFLYFKCIYENGNYTNNSTYRSNLDTALSSITSNINTTIYGFANTSVGRNSDTANVLALCRGDVDPVTCGQCVYNSTLRLREKCPNQKEAIGGYDFCMLRYSNRSSILTDMEENPSFLMSDDDNVTDVDRFNEDLKALMDTLRTRAADGGPLQKFATGNMSSVDFLTIYGLVQCSPNLLANDCDRCLVGAVRGIPGCCNGKIGGRVIRPSCMVRFEVNPFFTVTTVTTGEDDNSRQTVVIIVVPIFVFVFLVVVGIWIFISKRKKRKPNEPLENVDDRSTVEALQYDLGTIRTATDNFSESNKLGHGGFGAVYKGRLQNGLEIAVKRLSENSTQGELEFKNEVVLLAKLQHRNLVRLRGFCLQGVERLLIYEFVPNASLDHFIFDPVNKANLDWDRRYKIIRGVARGLLYLHEDSRHRIIHRDIKASNILLNAEMNPKIADFGLAKLFEGDETQGKTSRKAGTYGYMAPEYFNHGQFSVKSDVFSFGVLVLEIVSGQRRNGFRNGEDEEDLLSYAWKSWKEPGCMNLIDPILMYGSSPIRDMMRCIHIGLLCVQENARDRPTMASIVLMLNSFSITLSVPSEPGVSVSIDDKLITVLSPR